MYCVSTVDLAVPRVDEVREDEVDDPVAARERHAEASIGGSSAGRERETFAARHDHPTSVSFTAPDRTHRSKVRARRIHCPTTSRRRGRRSWRMRQKPPLCTCTEVGASRRACGTGTAHGGRRALLARRSHGHAQVSGSATVCVQRAALLPELRGVRRTGGGAGPRRCPA